MKAIEMTELTITIMSLLLFASVVSKAQTSEAQAPTSSSIKISRNDSLKSKKASGEYFTGSVQVQELFPAYDPSRTSGGKVAFEPGARSAWHTHPLGQIAGSASWNCCAATLMADSILLISSSLNSEKESRFALESFPLFC
jgi:hypothetical protein